jgi:hypothetical protein
VHLLFQFAEEIWERDRGVPFAAVIPLAGGFLYIGGTELVFPNSFPLFRTVESLGWREWKGRVGKGDFDIRN